MTTTPNTTARQAGLTDADSIAREAVEQFKAALYRVPGFGNRVNKEVREKLTEAHCIMLNLPALLDQAAHSADARNAAENSFLLGCNDVVGATRCRPAHETGHPIAKSDDMVLVRREMVGAACYAISNQKDAPKVLAYLRAIAMSDASNSATGHQFADARNMVEGVALTDALQKALIAAIVEHTDSSESWAEGIIKQALLAAPAAPASEPDTFERARVIVEKWPGWKRAFTLTPYSIPAPAAQADDDLAAFAELIDDYQCAQKDGSVDDRAQARIALLNAYRDARQQSVTSEGGDHD